MWGEVLNEDRGRNVVFEGLRGCCSQWPGGFRETYQSVSFCDMGARNSLMREKRHSTVTLLDPLGQKKGEKCRCRYAGSLKRMEPKFREKSMFVGLQIDA